MVELLVSLIFIFCIIMFLRWTISSESQPPKSSYKEFYKQNIANKKIDVDEQVDNETWKKLDKY